MSSDIQQTLSEFMDLYYELKQYIKTEYPYLFERWKAGGFTIDNDVLTMYPTLEQCVDAIAEDEPVNSEDENDDDGFIHQNNWSPND